MKNLSICRSVAVFRDMHTAKSHATMQPMSPPIPACRPSFPGTLILSVVNLLVALVVSGGCALKVLLLGLIFTGSWQLVEATETGLSLKARVTEKDRHAIFQPGEMIRIELTVSGERLKQDRVLWSLKNYLGETLEQGDLLVPAGAAPFRGLVVPGTYGSGYYEFHARLEQANVTLPHLGTRPSGVMTYGILPTLKALPLRSPAESRFGIQGTTFCESGVRLKGNQHDPFYSLLGVKWFYGDRRLQNLYRYKDKPHQPKLTEEDFKWSYRSVREGNFAMLWDIHSVPGWLMNSPKPIKHPEKLAPAHQCQRYAPHDYDAYGKMVEAVASEIVAGRKHVYPYMTRNTYQIHWEPDWHWGGTDEEFIKIYETAFKAIRKVDPTAVLAGANYGVLFKGNRLLESLFKKGLGSYMNGITFHAYFLNQKIPPEEMGLIPEMKKLVALRDQYLGPKAPIHQTEWGFNWKGKYLSHDVPREELIRELAWTLRGHGIILGEGADSTWFFYAADNGGKGGGFAYNLDEVVRVGPATISPKPKTMATCAFTRMLEGTQSLGPMKALGDDVYGYLFRRGDQLVTMVWSKKEATRTVIDTGLPETTLVDCMGNQRNVKTEAGRIELTVGSVPQYVLGLSKNILSEAKQITTVPGEHLETGRIPRGIEVSLTRGMRSIPVVSAETALPLRTDPGEWLLRFSDVDSGYLTKCVPVTVMKCFELLELDLASAGRYALKLRNNRKAKSDLTIRLLSGNSVGCTQRVTLLPESTNVIALTTPKSFQVGDEITVEAIGQGGVSESKRVAFGNVIPAADRSSNPPVADGNLKDWLLEDFTQMSDRESLALKKAPWGGAGDFSVRYSLAYDKDNFYCAFRVFDQTHFPPLKEDESWRGDSLQLAFGVGLDASGNAAKTKKISLELSRSGRMVVKELSKAPPIPPTVKGILTDQQLVARVVRDEIDSATIYEVAIPWKWITGEGRPNRLGFGAMINDADNQEEVVKNARKTMQVGKGPGLFNIMLKFHAIHTK